MPEIEQNPELVMARKKFRRSIIFLIIGVFYGIMPCDIIPDILIPLGWVDDTAILFSSMVYSLYSYIRLKKQENS